MSHFAACDYQSILKDHLAHRRAKYYRYGVRAFARELGISPARLSHVLKGRYGLSGAAAQEIGNKLGFSKPELDYFVALAESKHARSTSVRLEARTRIRKFRSDYRPVEGEALHLLSDWYHLAIVELCQTVGFESDPAWIAGRLGIQTSEAKTAIDRMIRFGMLEKKSGRLKPRGNFYNNPSGAPNVAVRKFHRQMIERALAALDSQLPGERDFSNLMIAIDPEDLPFVRKKLQELRNELDAVLSQRPKRTRVYALNLQFFHVHDSKEIK